MDSFAFDANTDHLAEIDNKENEGVDLELDNWFSTYQNSNRPRRQSKSRAIRKMTTLRNNKRNGKKVEENKVSADNKVPADNKMPADNKVLGGKIDTNKVEDVESMPPPKKKIKSNIKKSSGVTMIKAFNFATDNTRPKKRDEPVETKKPKYFNFSKPTIKESKLPEKKEVAATVLKPFSFDGRPKKRKMENTDWPAPSTSSKPRRKTTADLRKVLDKPKSPRRSRFVPTVAKSPNFATNKRKVSWDAAKLRKDKQLKLLEQEKEVADKENEVLEKAAEKVDRKRTVHRAGSIRNYAPVPEKKKKPTTCPMTPNFAKPRKNKK